MEKINNNKKSVFLWCLLSAGIAGVIFVAFCAINGIMPFGEMSILRNDASAQYAPFLAEYITKIKAGDLSFWNWSLGGGINELAFVCYYLLSPFNLLALPFNAGNIEVAFVFVILIKTMCIAFTTSYFFQKKFADSGLMPVVFSLIFTFSGFYMAYYFNTMWLDALIALPLIALGIENIVNGKKATLYFFSLAYAIFVNFYMGYMVCLFSVMYFFYLLFAKDVTTKEDKKDELPIMQVMVKYGFASVFAGLVCFVIILPVIYAMGNSNSRSNFEQTEPFFNFMDFLTAHLSALPANSNAAAKTEEIIPMLFSSMLTFVSLPLFFFSKKIKINKKLSSVAVILLLFFSMIIPKMNYFWHGFSEPTGLPYRFSFIYIFFIIILAYETVKSIKDVPIWAFGISGALVIATLVYTKFSAYQDIFFSTRTIVVSAVAFAVYLAVLLIRKFDKLNTKAMSLILTVCFIAEIFVGGVSNIAARPKLINNYEKINSAMRTLGEAKDNKQQRSEILVDGNYIQSYSSIYNYNGLSVFSSLTDTQYAISQMTLGNFGNYANGFYYVSQTPIYNAMMSMDYVLDTMNLVDDNNPYYDKVRETDAGTIYKVKYNLPMGYCISKDIDKFDPFNNMSFSVQKLFCNYAVGEQNIFNDITAVAVTPYNCDIVDFDALSEYEKEVASQEGVDSEREHEHEHEHESEETSAVDENAETITFDSWWDLVDKVGSTYPIKLTGEDSNVTLEFVADESGEVFSQVTNYIYEKLTLKRENGEEKVFDVSWRRVIDLGYFNAGEKYTIVISDPAYSYDTYNHDIIVNSSLLVSMVSINEEKFLEGYNKILENGVLNIEEFEDTHIYGTVNSTVDGYMMMPMPYDLGWTIWVDGEEVEPYEHESHIMMFPISTGEHTVEMKYFPQGLKEGIFVSLAAILGLVLVLLLGKVHKMKLELEAEEAKENAEKADEAAEVKSEEAESNATEADSGKKEE